MKKLYTILLAGTLFSILAFQSGNVVLPIGAEMPKANQQMKDISGKQVSMKNALKGNGVLVMFSCNTCPYVVKNEQRIITAGELAAKLNIGFIIINSNEAYRETEDSYEAMKAYAAEKKYNWYYVVDQNSEVADAFGANRTPECFLFDKNLTLAYHGAIDDNPSDETAVKRQHLREAMMELSSGKSIAVKESRSVGCTIKRKS
ncbi:MAG: thioredoxin family protein [Sphingobacteriales bacterium]|nr:thioredoxin family protein [Sphingobacteriales bacterium]